MPLKTQFKEPKIYLKVLLSQIAISIVKNENKELKGIYKMSEEEYHELISELTSIIIFKDFSLDIDGNSFQHSSNILKKWLPIFKGDYKILYGAIKDAEDIKELIMENYKKYSEEVC